MAVDEQNARVDTKAAILAFNAGAQAMERGDEAAAIAAWREALRIDDCLIPAALNLITYYQQLGNLKAQLELWEQVLAYDPFDTDHIVLQAAAFRRAGQARKAVDNYHRAIAIYPYFKFWYHELAGIYRELGEVEEAELWKGRGDSLGADEAEICYEDGVRHVGDERWPSARICFEAVLEEFPANLDARLRLARVLERAGTEDEVVDQYQQALKLTEAAKGLVHYRLGEYLFRRDRLDEAEAELLKASASVPVYKKADRAVLETRWKRQLAAQGQGAAPESAPLVAAGSAAASTSSVAAELALLRPEEIGMEPIDGPAGAPTPEFVVPNPRLPWQQQLRHVLDQVLSIAAPGGREPRISFLVEPDSELIDVVDYAVGEMRSLGRSLRTDNDQSHVFVVRSEPPHDAMSKPRAMSGWLGPNGAGLLDTGNWGRAQPGIPLASALSAVRAGAGEQGFNCLLIASFGRCVEMGDEIEELLRTTPLHSICFVHPRYHYLDMARAVSGSTPNFVDIAL